MAILTEGARNAAFIVSEANAWRSRDEVTVTVPAGGLEAGTVVGIITATGKFVRHNSAATDGSQKEAGILVTGQSTTGDTDAAIIARDAEVNGALLKYASGANAAQIKTTNAALAALGIVVR